MNSINRIIWSALLLVSITTHAQTEVNPVELFGEPSGLPLPSTLQLVDYEKQLYPWIGGYNYKHKGWSVDKGVRDTGPFIGGTSYGTHSAVRIFYSPEMMEWLTGDRIGPIANGAMIIKEMYTSPAAIYTELAKDPAYADKADYETLLESVITSWVVMVKDSSLAHDGWFWGSVEIPYRGENLDSSIKNVMLDTVENRGITQLRWSGTAMPCMRCHASAEKELTFSDLANIEGHDEESPLVFRVDDSWRTPTYFSYFPLCNIRTEEYVIKYMYKGHDKTPSTGDCLPWPAPTPEELTPTGAELSPALNMTDHSLHNNAAYTVPFQANYKPNELFLSTFDSIPAAKLNKANLKKWALPPVWMDHVVMPADHPTDYITSDNCLGCHGGLAGSPNREVMFLPMANPSTGSTAKTAGLNLSEYGEWRWSPMGLAGRDPIFHAQLESEMALLERDNRLDKKLNKEDQLLKASLGKTQQAITNKCLTCHGAMGERQLRIDAKANPEAGLDSGFNMDYFYLPEILTKEDEKQQKKDKTADYVKYGALAREGISCMICHRIDAPKPTDVANWNPNPNPKHKKPWITDKTNKTLAYNLFKHSSGEFQKGPIGELFGPFDVAEKPMQHSFDLTPLKNDYISDSQMCGNCHTINLPNIGSSDKSQPVLKAAAEDAFKKYEHSIEQATFLEWQNSAFSAKEHKGKDGKETFKSCQHCHMPSGFETFDGEVETVSPLITQIASIQDTSYPEVGNSLPNDEIDIPVRDDYKRHTHVGLNVFLLSMVDQFSDLLGVFKTDYMTGVDTGIDLALDSMIQQAQNTTAALTINATETKNFTKDGVVGRQITADVKVANLTGHRYPSGVAFRRAFLELSVTDENDDVVWLSGGTNNVGVILNGTTDNPLDTEFLPDNIDGHKFKISKPRPSEKECLTVLSNNNIHYQPHYQVITEQDQVQIYEELNLNAQCGFTTSFVHRVHPIKDNRLLPKGWRESRFFKDQGEVMREFMHATDPEGNVVDDKVPDPDYISRNDLSFAGADNLKYEVFIPGNYAGKLKVTVTLYNQSIPPYWLKHRFDEAPNGRATRRLHYMASHLDLDKTAMQDWKLKLVSKSATVH